MTDLERKDDDALVALTLGGNNDAFATLVARYEKMVRAVAFRITGNRFLSDDACQDAFVSGWLRLGTLRDRQKFRWWICSIAENSAKTVMYRYHKAIGQISFQDLEEVDLEGSGESESVCLLMKNSESDELHEAVEALSEKIRRVVQLHYFEGFSVEEIAGMLSLPAGTVKWRLSEGRKQLRKEYGIMEKQEKQFIEDQSTVDRVKKQIEEFALMRRGIKWGNKGDDRIISFYKALLESINGLDDYKAVLQSVESLENSKEKSSALADVLVRGYWWLPGKKNEETLAQIKKAAEEGRNNEVMAEVMRHEYEKYSGKERLDYMKNAQIPYLEKLDFRKTLGYIWFWYGYYCSDEGGPLEETLAAYNKVLEILSPKDVYYANALSAIHIEKKVADLPPEERKNLQYYETTGELLRKIGGKLYFWSQPGYSRNGDPVRENAVFYNCAQCDKIICDPNMDVGEQVVGSDGRTTFTVKEKGVTVSTPAGVFEGCISVEIKGDRRSTDVYFCPGVGIVKQITNETGNTDIIELSSYTVKGGEGLIPLAEGNEWNYRCTRGEDECEITEAENSYKVIFAEENLATISHYAIFKRLGYTENWNGYIAKAKNEYQSDENDEINYHDVSKEIQKAAELAVTKRQRVHTEIAGKVLDRIYKTNPKSNPDYTEKGRFEFFREETVTEKEGKICIEENRNGPDVQDYTYDIGEGHKAIYNDIYCLLAEPMRCVWNEEWVPGYCHKEKISYCWSDDVELTFEVKEDETVKVKAGTFENCRHVVMDIKGMKYWVYRGGHMEYWFAPGVGIVKFNRPINYISCIVDNVWELTAYSGTGKGFFPLEDGMVRKYEQLTLENWHGWVEYTYDQDEKGFVIFRNASCTQDRASYEEYLKAKENPAE